MDGSRDPDALLAEASFLGSRDELDRVLRTLGYSALMTA
jgi:hypothetical protein